MSNAQLVKQYDSSSRAQFVGQYAEESAIQVIADFGRASVNASLSEVTTDTDDVLLIKLSARLQTTGGSTNRWIEPVAKITGIDGLRPRIEIVPYQSTAGTGRNHQTWLSSQRGHYSYDGETWIPFDTTAVGSDRLRFRNNTAFTEDEVWVARSWPRSVTQVGNQVASLASAYPAIIKSTASAITPSTTTGFPAQSFIVGEIDGINNELGEPIPSTPVYGFEIDDEAFGDNKIPAVIIAGVHAGEDVGEIVFWELIGWLLSSDSEAEALRAAFRIVVYPLLNPRGRWGGHWRGDFNSTEDTNRDWYTGSPVFPSTVIGKAAIQADTGGNIAFGFDIHASPTGETMQLGTRNDHQPSVDFDAYVKARYSGGNWGVYQNINETLDVTSGSIRQSLFPSLNANFRQLLETCDRPTPISPSLMQPYAEAMGGALYDMMLDGTLGALAPDSFEGEQTAADTITLTWDAVPGADGYEIEIDGGAPIDVGDVLTADATGLAVGSYDFRVRAYDSNGPGLWSDPIAVSVVEPVGLEAGDSIQSNVSPAGTITQIHLLAGVDSTQAAVSPSGTIGQAHDLQGAASQQGAVSGSSAISQTHDLGAVNSSQSNISPAGTLAVDGTVVLEGEPTVQRQVSPAGQIAQVHVLAAANSNQSAQSQPGAIGQVHQLEGLGSTQSALSPAGTIDASGAVSLQGVPTTQQARSPSGFISQTHNLLGVNSLQRAVSPAGFFPGDGPSGPVRYIYEVPDDLNIFEVAA